MRTVLNLGVALSGLCLLSGCIDSPQANQAKEKAEREIRKAEEPTADWVKIQREEYRKKVDADLVKLDQRMDSWKEKIKAANDDAKIKMQKRMDELKIQREKVREQVKDMNADTKEAWADVKKGADKAVAELHEAFEKADRKSVV